MPKQPHEDRFWKLIDCTTKADILRVLGKDQKVLALRLLAGELRRAKVKSKDDILKSMLRSVEGEGLEIFVELKEDSGQNNAMPCSTRVGRQNLSQPPVWAVEGEGSLPSAFKAQIVVGTQHSVLAAQIADLYQWKGRLYETQTTSYLARKWTTAEIYFTIALEMEGRVVAAVTSKVARYLDGKPLFYIDLITVDTDRCAKVQVEAHQQAAGLWLVNELRRQLVKMLRPGESSCILLQAVGWTHEEKTRDEITITENKTGTKAVKELNETARRFWLKSARASAADTREVAALMQMAFDPALVVDDDLRLLVIRVDRQNARPSSSLPAPSEQGEVEMAALPERDEVEMADAVLEGDLEEAVSGWRSAYKETMQKQSLKEASEAATAAAEKFNSVAAEEQNMGGSQDRMDATQCALNECMKLAVEASRLYKEARKELQQRCDRLNKLDSSRRSESEKWSST